MSLLKELLVEARVDYIAQQMGDKILAAYQRDNGRKVMIAADPLNIVKFLSKAGPEYIQWIVRQYIAGQFKMEDIPQIKSDLDKFKQLCKSKSLPSNDLNQFPTLMSLRQTMQDKNIAGVGYSGKLVI